MEYRLVQKIPEMEEILTLQRANLKQNLDDLTKESQGFVTLQHDIKLLQQMHAVMPSVIAREKDQLAGYALSLSIDCMGLFPELSGMYSQLPAMRFKGHPMANKRYYYMGQICVAEAFRGKGIFQGLYQAHARFFGNRFDCMVTEVSPLNKRSMAAHLKMGFDIIHEYEDESGEWCVIAWDWS
jgi:ribosomal protein S18 acetylase RimI-like enzyme